jgi:DNA polymerase III epsilon subunit-like protein
MKQVCVDFETNGLTPEDDSLSVSIRLLNEDGSPTDCEFYSLIYSDQKLDPEATAVNRLQESDIRNAPHPEEVVQNFLKWREDITDERFQLLGHCILIFDNPRLEKLFGELYRDLFDYHIQDTSVMARMLKDAGLLSVISCGLVTLAKHFKIENPQAHHASGDTLTTARVFVRLNRILRPNLLTRIIRVFVPQYSGR